MAQANLPLATFDGGAVNMGVVYDDVSLAVAAVSYQNTSGQPAPITVTPPHGAARSFSVPQGNGSWDLSKRGFTLVADGDGELALGFDVQITWGRA